MESLTETASRDLLSVKSAVLQVILYIFLMITHVSIDSMF